MANIEDVLWVFAQSEADQEIYFPVLDAPVWVWGGNFELETDSARMVMLCVLCDAAQHASGRPDAFGELCAEIWSLTWVLIQLSGIWPFLMLHPSQVPLDGTVEPHVYRMWAILRRLCFAAIEADGCAGDVVPFTKLAKDFVNNIEEIGL